MLGPTPLISGKDGTKRSEAQIDMNRPNVLKEYNSFMSGVDLSDMLIQLCRTDIKGKKWYMHLIYYFLGVSVVNVWLLYRRNHHSDAEMSLLLVRLRTDIADWLLRGAIVSAMRKVRPPSEFSCNFSTPEENRVSSSSVCYDNLAHWSEMVDERRDASPVQNMPTLLSSVSSATYTFALTKDKDCFKTYHSNA